MHQSHREFKLNEIARILRKHPGSKVELAKRASVKHPNVSNWLKGKTTSANIAAHAQQLVAELTANEAA